MLRRSFPALIRRVRPYAVAGVVALGTLSLARPTEAATQDPTVQSRTLDTLLTVVRDYVQQFGRFVGVIAVAAMIYGGFVMMTAGTNEQRYALGKGVLTKAGIGAVIAWGAYYFAGLLKGAADRLG